MINQAWDKKGLPIRHGDLLKVFHFTGARRKRYYMYKQAWVLTLSDGRQVLMADHLESTTGTTEKTSYRLTAGLLENTEIIQGYQTLEGELDHEDRPKLGARHED